MTELENLRDDLRKFSAARDWEQFHSPKNLSMSLSIEAAELMEHFQWITADESRALADSPEKVAAIGEEMADVLCYLLALSSALRLDISQAVRAKMLKNAAKYPAAEYRGRYGPEDERPPHAD